ncbi:MAG TPA: hypothetical protein VJN21_10860 [Candidatus Acidoferrales bacterium]|nr:hypothetical protein [Candidatus Acidoferrales bacterium]
MISGRILQLTAAQLIVAALPVLAWAQQPATRSQFHIKYVADGAVYLDGGQSDGLVEGTKLKINRPSPGTNGAAVEVAELSVASVASTSAVCDILSSTQPIQVGDVADLEQQAVQTIQKQQVAASASSYAQVVTFSEGDPLDEERRAEVPRPPSPEINRTRGRIGMEYNTILGQPGFGAAQEAGLDFRAEMTRIMGSYWNFQGYWRGRLSSEPMGVQQVTLTDLINRTYVLSLNYANPHSAFIAGFGRLYLPSATSLGTIDGGYMGWRLTKKLTLGMFGGSTPDPTQWNYNPGRELGGTFFNVESGDFSSSHLSTTVGVAISDIHWKPDRQFGFLENTFFFKRVFSIYDAAQADLVRPATTTGPPPPKAASLTQNFVTLRLLPYSRVSFDVNDTYFRNPPSFAPQLVSTGLLRNYLFQGLSGGVTVKLPLGIALYTDLGPSARTGDVSHSLNQLYGITLSRLGSTQLHLDLRYSKFDSSFGRGAYESFSLSRFQNGLAPPARRRPAEFQFRSHSANCRALGLH